MLGCTYMTSEQGIWCRSRLNQCTMRFCQEHVLGQVAVPMPGKEETSKRLCCGRNCTTSRLMLGALKQLFACAGGNPELLAWPQAS